MKLPRSNALLGALLAPLTPGVLLVLLSIFLGRPNEGVWMFMGATLVAYPAMLVAGLPIHLAYSLLGLVRIWPYLIAGLLTGAVLAWVMSPLAPNFALSTFLGACGAVTGAVFWLLTRPDRLLAPVAPTG